MSSYILLLCSTIIATNKISTLESWTCVEMLTFDEFGFATFLFLVSFNFTDIWSVVNGLLYCLIRLDWLIPIKREQTEFTCHTFNNYLIVLSNSVLLFHSFCYFLSLLFLWQANFSLLCLRANKHILSNIGIFLYKFDSINIVL